MKNGIVYVLETTTDETIMCNLLKNMSNNDLFLLFNLVEFLDESVKQRWVSAYNLVHNA